MRFGGYEKTSKSIALISDLPDSLSVLDFYAGEAQWITPQLKRFSDVHLLEIRPDFEAKLRERMPHAKVSIGDSYQMAQLPENRHRFDLVVMDNHVGAFAEHVEHFEAIQHVPTLLREKGGYLIVNVCVEPELLLLYNYVRNFRALWENTRVYWRKMRDGTFKRWLDGRAAFYGCESISQNRAQSTYAQAFAKMGYIAGDWRWEERRPFLYMLRMRVTPLER